MGTRGVWSLENVELKKPQDDWVEIPNVFTRSVTEYAYFAGGMDNAYNFKSDYDKLTYATDTTANVPSSNFGTPGSRYISATNSTTAGYHNHGLNPGNSPLTNVSKYTFASDSSSQLPTAGFIREVSGDKPYALFSVGTNTNGYFISGQPGPRSSCHKLVYSTDECNLLPGGDASLARARGMSVGTQTEGFFVGGFRYELPSNQLTTTIDKITYSNETTAASPSTLPASRYSAAPYNNSTAGYVTGGRLGPSETYVSSTTKIVFSSAAVSNVPGLNATLVRSKFNGIGGTKGFIGGGLKSDGGTNVSTVDKINLSTETAALSPSGQLTDERRSAGCFGPQGNAMPGSLFDAKRWLDGAAPAPPFALWAGGYIDASPIDRTSQIAKFTYATGTGEVLSNTLGERTSYSCSVGAPEAGYWKGGYGYPGPGSYWSNTWKCVYSTETTSEIPGLRGGNPGWSSGRTTAGLAVANTEKGYFGAGSPSFSFSFANANISRIPWATETNHNQPGANLRNSVIFLTGAGSQEVGYAFGGQQSNGNELSYVDKLTYANDTRSSGGNMTTYHYLTGSASSDTASYCFGGSPSPNKQIVEKYVWATDTASADTALSSPAENGMNANGKNDAGLLAGGGGKISSIQKYTYTTSTSSMEPGNMGYGARYMGGASASNNNGPSALAPTATPTATTMNKFPATLTNFGYQQGGSGSDEVRKIDFATEVGSEIPARLPNVRYDHCSFTSELASYISGGSTPSTTNSSQIDKTVYATGTSSRVVNGSSDSLEPGRRRSGGAGNKTNGWTMGGSPAKSKIDKFFYSSETNQGDGTWSNDGPGPNGRNWHSTLSAPNYIYAAGGGERSNFWRFAYSISSQQEVPGATLVRTPGSPTSYGAEGQIAGLGNKIQGYVGGGKNPGATGGSNPYMQKFVYATETATSLGEILTGSRYGVANCGDLETGYFLGGSDAGSTGTGKTMKLTYSSDTYAVCPAADTASQKQRGQGSGAKSFGIHTSSFPIVI